MCANIGKTCSGSSNEQISPSKWKSMEEEPFHTDSNKLSLTSNLANLDKIAIASENGRSIESITIEEEVVQASNHVNDDFYGVVWKPFLWKPREPFQVECKPWLLYFSTLKKYFSTPEAVNVITKYWKIYFCSNIYEPSKCEKQACVMNFDILFCLIYCITSFKLGWSTLNGQLSQGNVCKFEETEKNDKKCNSIYDFFLTLRLNFFQI